MERHFPTLRQGGLVANLHGLLRPQGTTEQHPTPDAINKVQMET